MIKNIIFDLGNVILKFNFKYYLQTTFQNKLSQEEIDILSKITFESNEWILLDEGTIEKDKAIENMLKKTPDNLKDDVIYIMMNWKDLININYEMVDFLKEQKEKDYKTYILSNAPMDIPFYVEDNNLAELFDGMVYSACEKQLKPHDDIYQTIINRYNLIPNECLFIDDRQENVDAAVRNGINAYRFDYNNYEEFRQNIKEMYNII